MTKKFLKIFLIAVCQIALLMGIVFADFSENQDGYLSYRPLEEISVNFVAEVEKKKTDEDNSKDKIDELYTELNQKNILKKTLPKLRAFGIMEAGPGDDDDLEEEITRRELARLIIGLLNIEEEELKAAEDLNLFTDIGDDLSPKYINLAASLGILKGRDDGLFLPEEPVKYTEAITALVRVLGYEDEFLRGSWPEKHITKAASVGITKDIKFNISQDLVNRGDMIILINNTLKANPIEEKEQDNGFIMYEKSQETFLKNKFEINQYGGIKILEIKKNVNSEGEEKLVKFEFLTDMYNDEYKAGDIKTFKLSHEGDIQGLQNFVEKEVTIYVKDNNEVIYIEE